MLLDKLLSSLDVAVEPFSLCEVGPEQRLRLPGKRRAMVHFVLSGCGFVRSWKGAAQAIQPCSLAVAPPGLEHCLESSGEAAAKPGVDPDLTVACGFVRVRYGAALDLFDGLTDVLVADLRDVPQVHTAFQDILAEESLARPGSETMKVALMSQCLVHLLRRVCADETCSLPWLMALQDERLARALERILQRPGDPHTVESLARAAAMSRSAFAESFTKTFGLPPLSLLRRVRMERAWKLLEHGGDLSMEIVASRVGFTSRSHFSRAFKKHFGISPAARRGMP